MTVFTLSVIAIALGELWIIILLALETNRLYKQERKARVKLLAVSNEANAALHPNRRDIPPSYALAE